ncbi:MAG TPA: class I SAM-dependent methyltransferase, partial [Candidatus Thermoplasmatota archaeon]|nr:class I SAM-dependent methyltransferase [Candidatus Thermoplasmatota archaeon]
FGEESTSTTPKFLALVGAELAHRERVAFRLLKFLKAERRLEWLDEVLPAPLARGGVDVVVSTNAIHLYGDLDATIAAWARTLRPGGHVHVQSGNVLADAPGVVIDDTVAAAAREAERLARASPEEHAADLARLDAKRTEYDDLRRRYFLPPRPLGHYVRALEGAGLKVERVRHQPVRALAHEWYEFLAVYAEGILPWVGGAEKIDGRPATEEDAARRLALLRRALGAVLGGAEAFEARWTYVTCRKP